MNTTERKRQAYEQSIEGDPYTEQLSRVESASATDLHTDKAPVSEEIYKTDNEKRATYYIDGHATVFKARHIQMMALGSILQSHC
jgi:hypothetical protein